MEDFLVLVLGVLGVVFLWLLVVCVRCGGFWVVFCGGFCWVFVFC